LISTVILPLTTEDRMSPSIAMITDEVFNDPFEHGRVWITPAGVIQFSDDFRSLNPTTTKFHDQKLHPSNVVSQEICEPVSIIALQRQRLLAPSLRHQKMRASKGYTTPKAEEAVKSDSTAVLKKGIAAFQKLKSKPVADRAKAVHSISCDILRGFLRLHDRTDFKSSAQHGILDPLVLAVFNENPDASIAKINAANAVHSSPSGGSGGGAAASVSTSSSAPVTPK